MTGCYYYHMSVVEGRSLLGCDAMLLGLRVPDILKDHFVFVFMVKNCEEEKKEGFTDE